MSIDTLLVAISAVFVGLCAGFGMGVGIKVTDTVIKYYEKNIWLFK